MDGTTSVIEPGGAEGRPDTSGGLELASASEAETIAIGRALGRALAARDVVLISGELGAGKTRLVQGIAAGIDAPDETRSPTFVLVNEYTGRLKLAHCDLYRLGGVDDTLELGLDDYLAEGAALAVEWPERARGAFPDDALEVEIAFGPGPRDRLLGFRAAGPGSERLLAAFGEALPSRQVGARPGRNG